MVPTVVVMVVLTFGALTPLRASGSTIDDKKAEAAHLEAEIQDNGNRVDALDEQYNGAVLDYQHATAAVAHAGHQLVVAQKQEGKMRALVSTEAAILYTGAEDPTSLLPSTDITSVDELSVRTQYGAVTTGNDEHLIAELERSQQDLKIEQKALDKQVAAAKAKRDYIAASRRAVEQASAQEQQLLEQVKGEIATLIAEQQARIAAEIKASLERLAAGQNGGGSSVPPSSVGGDLIPNLPAPSPARRGRDRVRRSAARKAVSIRRRRARTRSTARVSR